MPQSALVRQRKGLQRRMVLVFGAILCLAGGAFAGFAALTPTEVENGRTGLLSAGFVALLLLALLAWLAVNHMLIRPLLRITAEIRFLSEAGRESDIPPQRYPAFAPLPQLVNDLIGRVTAARRDTQGAVVAATAKAEEQKSLLETILRDLSTGVVVCSLDHRILLYNQVAFAQLNRPADFGLGRSLFAFVTDEPIRHTLDRLTHREPTTGNATEALVCATPDARGLLRARMTLLSADDTPTGYILTLSDATTELTDLDRRDRLLRTATDGMRSPIANLQAAAETLTGFADIDTAKRQAFEQVILREAETLGRNLEAIERDRRTLTTSHWPLTDIHSVDLLNCVIRRLRDTTGPAVTMVGLPLWLHGDSHSLVIALERLLLLLVTATGQRQYDAEALLSDRRVYIEISWDGAPVPASIIDTWMAEPMQGAPGAATLGDVLQRHDSDIWSHAVEGTRRATLRLPLPAPTRIQFLPPKLPLPPRPEFYDFEATQITQTSDRLEHQSLRSVPYVVFDTETTGLQPSQGDEMVALGAVRVVNGRLLTGETFSRLINPGRPIPPESSRFHGITDAMVRDAPPAAVILPQFLGFIGDAVLVAHNAAFDLKFIRMKTSEGGPRFDMPALDTMLISMFLYPELPGHDLDTLALRLGISVSGRHSALGDAMTTAGVFVRLIDLLEARGITTIGALVRASNMALDIKLRQEQF
jgi:DNA polymerase III subunit epsilon